MSIRDRSIPSARADLDIQRDDSAYQIGLCRRWARELLLDAGSHRRGAAERRELQRD